MTGSRARLGVLALTFLACGGATAAPEAKVILAFSGVHTIDPAQALNASEHRVIGALFEGLTVVDASKPGAVLPGVAASWEAAPDGKTWTFHLRPEAKWSDGSPVTARDFACAWTRLASQEDPRRSPHAPLLEGFVGARALTQDAHVSKLLTQIDEQLGDLIEGKRLSADELRSFVDDSGFRSATAHMDAATVRKLRDYPEGGPPLSPGQAKQAKEAIGREASAAGARGDEARARVGVDQGWFAKDDRTFVVQTIAPMPHLPLLAAHPSLVPLSTKTCRARQHHFDGFNLPTNGPYVSRGEAPDKSVPKLVLEKSPTYWNAAAVPTARFEVWLDAEDTLDRWKSGELAWAVHNVGSVPGDRTAFTPGALQDMAKVADAYYEATGGAVYLVRFRCDQAPMNDLAARRAFALAIDRAALAAAVRVPKLVPTARVVAPTVAGAPPAPAAPAWAKGADAAKRVAEAKAMAAKVTWPDLYRLLVVADEALEPAVRGMASAWKAAFGAEDSRWDLKAEDARVHLEKAGHHVLVSPFRPAYDDALAYLEVFRSDNPASETGWKDPTYDALIDAARDPAAFAKAPTEAVTKGVPDPAPIQAAIEAAKGGKTDALRAALLQAAEARLLDQAVVVPLWLAPEVGLVRKGLVGVGKTTRAALDLHPLPAVAFDAGAK